MSSFTTTTPARDTPPVQPLRAALDMAAARKRDLKDPPPDEGEETSKSTHHIAKPTPTSVPSTISTAITDTPLATTSTFAPTSATGISTSSNSSCPFSTDKFLCGATCIDPATRKCCSDGVTHCKINQDCVTGAGCVEGHDSSSSSGRIAGIVLVTMSSGWIPTSTSTSTSTSGSSMEDASAFDMGSMSTAPSSAVWTSPVMSAVPTTVVRLWHPPQSAGRKWSVPHIFRAMLLLRSVAAFSFPQATAPAIDVIPISDLSNTISHTPRPNGEPVYCAQGLEHCGPELCFQPPSEKCCPDQRNLCNAIEICAVKSKGPLTVWGCAPACVTDGMDSRIRTVSMTSMSDSTTTTTGTSATTVAASASAPASEPTGSGSSRLGVPGLLRSFVLVVQGARALASPSPLGVNCCAGICCPAGEVCVRSSTGLKCWHEAGRYIPRDGEIKTIPVENVEADSLGDESSDPTTENDEDMIDLVEKKGKRGRVGGERRRSETCCSQAAVCFYSPAIAGIRECFGRATRQQG
ncbi:hypothetical protein EK21DRAFT_89626 [Setomelanomma holmii]|uniref:Uncharacterized protein n=1 Tax=Setomelanomma holmii TaxID=210430 RepID=A0A9P4HA54_9PLEO|nr:hypothetical protein EK21DRAFT_89626 [Setomelanomma holmii]